ncbi:phosphoribosylglycinamide formyltransferase [Periweissella cryptocerci]|uniref:Phosphoribosylglycinamide formyltransferase n=1 Tax=Periweissella cryptocerci TaxID=2506420 RepID=A0A4P6YS40_9LACO|nr:phosphoribosylglycinamide formyltransferase [Periweissella cryptocerci]QBO35489.1 phosphoribosylglycinamide formyltransferase [Periweissella cryptocerci]
MNTKLAIFASGTGTNFVALADAITAQQLPAQIVLLVVDHPDIAVIERAKERNVPAFYLNYKSFPNKQAAELALVAKLQAASVDLILLAGYMRILTPTLLDIYPKRVINIHPALLPNFPGRHGILDAFNAGVTETGVTVHYVDAGIDTGEIIQQAVVPIEAGKGLAALETQIHAVEHELYPTVLAQLITTED